MCSAHTQSSRHCDAGINEKRFQDCRPSAPTLPIRFWRDLRHVPAAALARTLSQLLAQVKGRKMSTERTLPPRTAPDMGCVRRHELRIGTSLGVFWKLLDDRVYASAPTQGGLQVGRAPMLVKQVSECLLGLEVLHPIAGQ